MDVLDQIAEKVDDFIAGRYGNLTTAEIEELRAAQADPYGTKFDKEHAGEVMLMDQLDLNGFLFVEFPHTMTLEESFEMLKKIVGPRPITPAVLWCVVRNGLIEKEASHV